MAAQSPVATIKLKISFLETFMPFDSFAWISEFVSLSLQSYCFFLFRGRKSLQLLMVLLSLNNLTSIATHTMPWPYFYQLYFGRIIIALVGLWAVADVACYPAKPSWMLRVPVGIAALLAIPYSPLNPNNGPAEFDQYRLFCLGFGLFILVLHIVFLIIDRQKIELPLLLMIAWAAESTAVAFVLKVGYMPRYQMICWWIGIFALGNFRRTYNSERVPLLSPSDLPLPAQDSQSASSASIDVGLRLPLQSRLPHSRVFERWQI